MTRLAQAESQRQRILDALAEGPRTLVELVEATGMDDHRLAPRLLRMTNAGEITRTRTGTRPDGHPCYVYRAAVRSTVTSREVGARLAVNVNGHKAFVRPAVRDVPAVRLFGGL